MLGRPCDQVFPVAGEGVVFCDLLPAPGQKNNLVVRLAGGGEATLSVTRAWLSKDRQAAGEARHRLPRCQPGRDRPPPVGLLHRQRGARVPHAALGAGGFRRAADGSGARSDPGGDGRAAATLHLGVLGLQTLVDNLLESASIEAGHFRVSPRPSDLKKIIAEAVATMRPLLEKYNQRLVDEAPSELPDVLADPRRTAQVLVNLLSNASKYGPADEEIELAVTLAGDRVRVAVADRGPGISGGQAGGGFPALRVPHGGGRSGKSRSRAGLVGSQSHCRSAGRASRSGRPPGRRLDLLVYPAAGEGGMKALIVDDDRVLADVVCFCPAPGGLRRHPGI